MEYAYVDVGGREGVLLSGRFTYEDSGKFHQLLEDWDFAKKSTLHIDARYLTFLDSTAIGMLYLLATRCREAGGYAVVVNAQPNIVQTLKRASLDQYLLFK